MSEPFRVGDQVVWLQSTHGVVVRVGESGCFDIRFHGQSESWLFDDAERDEFHLLKGFDGGEEE